MLVGRTHELEAAAEYLSDRVPLLVVGEAGIGKTAFLREAARSSRHRTYEGGGLATLSWMPYLAPERALGKSLQGRDGAAVADDIVRVGRFGYARDAPVVGGPTVRVRQRTSRKGLQDGSKRVG
jgi:hypothetical protein